MTVIEIDVPEESMTGPTLSVLLFRNGRHVAFIADENILATSVLWEMYREKIEYSFKQAEAAGG